MPADQNQYFICGKCSRPTHNNNNNSYRSQHCKWCAYEMPEGQRDAVRPGSRDRSSPQPQAPDAQGRGESSAVGTPLKVDPCANLPQSAYRQPAGSQGLASGRRSRRPSISGRETARPPAPQRSGSQSSSRSSYASTTSTTSSYPSDMAAAVIWCAMCSELRPKKNFIGGEDFCDRHQDRPDEHWCATCGKSLPIADFCVDAH